MDRPGGQPNDPETPPTGDHGPRGGDRPAAPPGAEPTGDHGPPAEPVPQHGGAGNDPLMEDPRPRD